MKNISFILVALSLLSVALCGPQTFYLTFVGTISNAVTGNGVATARSLASVTTISDFGVTSLETQSGEAAVWRSDFDLTGPIFDRGNITIGNASPANLLFIDLISIAPIDPATTAPILYASGIYNVTGGTGIYNGVQGFLSFVGIQNNSALTYVQNFACFLLTQD
eukprot:Phypoly_transcript_23760.p1 GENE.Phypoly_transcript_23760~~Phypoly_transcript_23760.p1  ORF type:complete len:165 (+),score=20.11 Phypoly_transcript_23760:2-496(+)